MKSQGPDSLTREFQVINTNFTQSLLENRIGNISQLIQEASARPDKDITKKKKTTNIPPELRRKNSFRILSMFKYIKIITHYK